MKVPQALEPISRGRLCNSQLLCHKVLRWLSARFVVMTFISASLLLVLDSHPLIMSICSAMALGLALARFTPFSSTIRAFRQFTHW